jgi:hypothetical protein
MNLMTTINGSLFCAACSCLCLILKQNSGERMALVLCLFKQNRVKEVVDNSLEWFVVK